MKEIKHYIAVRFFNQVLGKFTQKDLLSDEMLRMGTSLLELNLLRSLENQTCKNFELVLLIHDKLDHSSQHFTKLTKLADDASFKVSLMTGQDFNKLLATHDPTIGKRIVSRVDYDDLVLNLVVADIQAVKQEKPLLIYGYSNGWIWRDDNKHLYEADKRYGFGGHFSAMQSVVLDMDSPQAEGFLRIHPYLWDHSQISTGLDKSFIAEHVQIKHNVNLRAYVWMRHKNTGSLDPYRLKADALQQVVDQKTIKALDFEAHFGRKLEVRT